MSDKTFGFVYLWRDRKHNRYYVGCHWGLENDRYICSSRWMKLAYAKRPNDFKRRIIQRIYSSQEDLYIAEQHWLDLIKPEEIKPRAIHARYYNLNTKAQPKWQLKSAEEKLSIREKISASVKKSLLDPEVQAKKATGYKKRDNKSSDPATREKRRLSMQEAMSKKFPIENRRVRAKRGSAEESVMRSANSKKRWADPTARERHAAITGDLLRARYAANPELTCAGKFWWNDGSKNTRARECPGILWARGKLRAQLQAG